MNSNTSQILTLLSRILLSSLLILSIVSCRSSAVKNVDRESYSAGAIKEPIFIESLNRNIQIDEIDSDSSIFSPFTTGYDLNPTDKISVAQQNQYSPLRLKGDGNQVAWMDMDFFLARMKLLENAKKSVLIQTYILANDESTRLIANKLIELAQRGVEVKFIIDPALSFKVKDRSLLLQMQKNGIEIAGYDPLFANYTNIVLNFDEFGLGSGNINMRYHEKIFLVDSEASDGQAIIGGVNFGNNYFRADPTNYETMWRDRDLMVRGPILNDIRKVFYENFSEIKSNSNSGDTSDLLSGIGGLLFGRTGPLSLSEFDSNIVNNLQAQLNRSWNPQWQDVDMRFIRSRPRHQENLIMPVVLDLINQSKKEILINNSYFLPTIEVMDALSAAASRGVKIKIVTNHEENSDFKQINILARVEYKKLLRFNQTLASQYGDDLVEIYEWAGEPVLQNGEGMTHSKYAVFDRKAVMVGSFNLDPRSFNLNSETVIIFDGEAETWPYVREFYTEIQPEYSLNVDYQSSLTFVEPTGLREKLLFKISDSLKSNY